MMASIVAGKKLKKTEGPAQQQPKKVEASQGDIAAMVAARAGRKTGPVVVVEDKTKNPQQIVKEIQNEWKGAKLLQKKALLGGYNTRDEILRAFGVEKMPDNVLEFTALLEKNVNL